MRRVWLWMALLLAVGWPAAAQPITQGTLAATGSITGNPGVAASMAIQVSGTWSGTITFEVSADGTNYVSALATSTTDGSTATTTTANGSWTISNGGYSSVRARMSTYTSGTASIAIQRGYAVARTLGGYFGNVVASNFCLSATTQDSYFAEVGANNPGAYTGGTSCAGGTLRFDWNSTRTLFAVPLYTPTGTAAAPAVAQGSDPDNGMYFGTNQVLLSTAGVNRLTMSTGVLTFTNPVGDANDQIFTVDSHYGSAYINVDKQAAGDEAQVRFTTNGAATARIGPNTTTLFSLIVGTSTNSLTSNLSTGALLFPVSYGPVTLTTSATAPSGPVACISPTVTWSNGTAAFQVDVGDCTAETTLVVTLPAASNAWSCTAMNVTTSATAEVEMTASTATSATFTNYTRTTGIALIWVDGADVRISCLGG